MLNTAPRWSHARGKTVVPSGWQATLAATVLEILLPAALLVPAVWLYAVLIGAGMHVCFTLLLPRQLIGFSVGTVGSYFTFLAL